MYKLKIDMAKDFRRAGLLHYAAGELRSYTLYFPMHRRPCDSDSEMTPPSPNLNLNKEFNSAPYSNCLPVCYDPLVAVTSGPSQVLVATSGDGDYRRYFVSYRR